MKKKPKKGTAPRFGKKPVPESKIAPSKRRGFSVRADIQPGGALHVRHMGDDKTMFGAEDFGVTLMAQQVVDAADKPVWIQVAKCGVYRGHPAGPFVFDSKIFDEIIGNFKASENRAIPIDFEHASEQDPAKGSIPVNGAPAQGWITDLRMQDGEDGKPELWGLTTWGDLARNYIKNLSYRFFSPAIRFNSKDRVTGKPIGARMSSGALTNNPFLDGMKPMAAKDAPSEEVQTMLRDYLAHAPHEYMPQVKSALQLHPLSTPTECSDTLGKLRDAFDLCDGEVGMTADGIDLGAHMMPMRDLVGAKPGDTWDDIFDAVQDLIDAADDSIEEQEESGAEMSDKQTGIAPTTIQEKVEPIMAMTAEEKAAFEALETEKKNLAAANAELTLKLTAAEAIATAETARAEKSGAELLKLKDQGIQLEVTEVLLTYGKGGAKDRGYTEESRNDLITMLNANPEGFRKLHPKAEPANKVHLFRTVTPPEKRDPPTTVIAMMAGETVSQMTNRLMKPKEDGGFNMAYGVALSTATRAKANQPKSDA